MDFVSLYPFSVIMLNLGTFSVLFLIYLSVKTCKSNSKKLTLKVISGQKTGGQQLVGGLDCTVHRNFFGSQVMP